MVYNSNGDDNTTDPLEEFMDMSKNKEKHHNINTIKILILSMLVIATILVILYALKTINLIHQTYNL